MAFATTSIISIVIITIMMIVVVILLPLFLINSGNSSCSDFNNEKLKRVGTYLSGKAADAELISSSSLMDSKVCCFYYS